MNWLGKLERKFGRYAVKNLMLYITILYGVGLIINIAEPSFYWLHLSLNISKILQGQVWRLITFIVYPPSDSIFWALILGYMFYNIGSTLEHIWGSFRFNIYYISGILFHIIGAFIVYFIWDGSALVTTSYLNWSLFIAFAATFPDTKFLLLYLIPVKAKVLGIIESVIFVISFVFAIVSRDWATALMIVMCTLNFVVFFILTRKQQWATPKVMKQRVKFKTEMKTAQMKFGQHNHKCSVCGQTDIDNPDLEFRYCSKCSGGKEYCMEHLYTHIHVTDDNKQHGNRL